LPYSQRIQPMAPSFSLPQWLLAQAQLIPIPRPWLAEELVEYMLPLVLEFLVDLLALVSLADTLVAESLSLADKMAVESLVDWLALVFLVECKWLVLEF